MTAKELLKPRFEVIVDYPDSQNLISVRQLNWWEYRKVEDMPNKLTNKNGTIYPVYEWDMQNMAAYVTERKSLWIPLTAYPTEYTFYPVD